MVELGNFQVRNKSQQKSEITFDTFTDTDTLKAFNRTSATRIYESFNRKIFTWSQEYIRDIFYKAEQNKNYTDYLVFLLQEEIYTLSETYRIWDWIKPSSANGSAYTIEGVTIPKMPDAGEAAFLLALLKAWKALCVRLKKKCAILGCPAGYEPDIQHVFEESYTVNGLKYIVSNYDMVYIYKFPTTGKATTFGYRAKEPLDYWRKTLGYTEKINYLLDTYFGTDNGLDVGSQNYNTVFDDFKNAADNGADIISCYPSINMLTGDSLATDRLIKIAGEYQPTQCKQIVCNFTITT
jgi:hypothetical protein